MGKRKEPYYGLPELLEDLKFPCNLQGSLEERLGKYHLQQYLGRYVWEDLPYGLNANRIERILYFRGEAVFFYVPELKQYFVLPYAYAGTPNCYGEPTVAIPLPFTGSTEMTSAYDPNKTKAWMPDLSRKIIYDPPMEALTEKDLSEYCIIIRDSTVALGQHVPPRAATDSAIIGLESKFIPYMNTALMASTGVRMMRVGNSTEADDVAALGNQWEAAALQSKLLLPTVGQIDFQDLASNSVANAEEYLVAMQSIDNFRRMGLGLGDGTLFQTKAHMLQSQMDMSVGRTDSILMDGLNQRFNACKLIFSVFGEPVNVRVSETAGDYDINGDGLQGETNDQDTYVEEGGDESDETSV